MLQYLRIVFETCVELFFDYITFPLKRGNNAGAHRARGFCCLLADNTVNSCGIGLSAYQEGFQLCSGNELRLAILRASKLIYKPNLLNAFHAAGFKFLSSYTFLVFNLNPILEWLYLPLPEMKLILIRTAFECDSQMINNSL